MASSLVYISFFNYQLYILTTVLLVYHESYYLASLLLAAVGVDVLNERRDGVDINAVRQVARKTSR